MPYNGVSEILCAQFFDRDYNISNRKNKFHFNFVCIIIREPVVSHLIAVSLLEFSL